MNQKINTKLGVAIIVVFAIMVGTLVWIYENDNFWSIQQSQMRNNTQQTIGTQTQDLIKNYLRPDRSKHDQPSMPTLADEASKSPEQLVKDFYDWYIKSNDYWRYQIYGSDHDPVADPINLDMLTKGSVFVSSTYEQNITKRRSNGDPVLCTQDTNYNIVKEYNNIQVYDNSAKVDIIRGYQDIPDVVKIQVILKKENNKWKIDDIICNKQ